MTDIAANADARRHLREIGALLALSADDIDALADQVALIAHEFSTMLKLQAAIVRSLSAVARHAGAAP